jgi:hypothetical protein
MVGELEILEDEYHDIKHMIEYQFNLNVILEKYEYYNKKMIEFIKKLEKNVLDEIFATIKKYSCDLSRDILELQIKSSFNDIDSSYLNYILDKVQFNKKTSKKKYYEINKFKIKNNLIDLIEFTTKKNIFEFINDQLNGRKNTFANFSLIVGDVQSGKTDMVLVILWLLIFCFEKKVLLCFQNLNQDIEQFLNRINIFNTGIKTLIECDDECIKNELFNDFLLNSQPIEFKKWKNKQNVKKPEFSVCLLNNIQTEINNIDIISDYICLIDEFDIVTPSGDNFLLKNKKTTKIEKNIAKIIKSSHFTFGITATPLTLLPNNVTQINNINDDDEISHIQWKFIGGIVLKPKNNYVGMEKCVYEKYDIDWFTINDYDSEEVLENNEIQSICSDDYNDIDDNYLKSIKNEFPQNFDNYIKIIKNSIIINNTRKYRSIIITDYHTTQNHENLAENVAKNIENIFILINNGDEIGFYVPLIFNLKINKLIKKNDIFCDLKNHKENNFDKNASYIKYSYGKGKNIEINLLYELLSVFMNSTSEKIYCLTIAGKLAGRGFSYVSNNFENYPFHLTDQIILKLKPSFASLYQSCRVFGKYNDYQTNKISIHTIDKILNVFDSMNMLNCEIKNIIPIIKNNDDIKNFCSTISQILSKSFVFKNSYNVQKIYKKEYVFTMPKEYKNKITDEIQGKLVDIYEIKKENLKKIREEINYSFKYTYCEDTIDNLKKKLKKYNIKFNDEKFGNTQKTLRGKKYTYDDVRKNKGWGLDEKNRFRIYDGCGMLNNNIFIMCYIKNINNMKIPFFEKYDNNPKKYEHENKNKKMFFIQDEKINIICPYEIKPNKFIYMNQEKIMYTELIIKNFEVHINTSI